jgi:hypothetical protein
MRGMNVVIIMVVMISFSMTDGGILEKKVSTHMSVKNQMDVQEIIVTHYSSHIDATQFVISQGSGGTTIVVQSLNRHKKVQLPNSDFKKIIALLSSEKPQGIKCYNYPRIKVQSSKVHGNIDAVIESCQHELDSSFAAKLDLLRDLYAIAFIRPR